MQALFYFNLSIKELDEPSTSWVLWQIRAEGQEMIAQDEMLREQKKGQLQEEAATEEADDNNDDEGNLTPLESSI